MNIRYGRVEDAFEIAELLRQLDYPAAVNFVAGKLLKLIQHPDALFIVAVDDMDKVIGFVSLHFIPQLGVEGNFCRISYFCVDQQSRFSGVGKLLEEAIVKSAAARNCDRIEVHCHARRSRAHSFYARQGYVEDPKYLLKKLSNHMS